MYYVWLRIFVGVEIMNLFCKANEFYAELLGIGVVWYTILLYSLPRIN